jgi:hypothetical protein
MSVTAPPPYDALPHCRKVTTCSKHSCSEPRFSAREMTNSRHYDLHQQLYVCREISAYVPDPLRLQVFQSIHDLSHSGTKATAKLVTRSVAWPGVQKNYHTLARICHSCQSFKISRHTFTSLCDFMLAGSPFPSRSRRTSLGPFRCQQATHTASLQ